MAGEPKFLLDPYLDWCKREGLPIHEDFGVDLLTAETAPWPRLGDGCKGAFAHVKGRGDWMTVFILDIPPGGKSAPQQHLYDEVFYVVSGHGSLVVETQDGKTHTFEWGPKSLFAPPLNARYRIFNGSGREPARIASANDMVLIMNVFHNEAFIFDNPFGFAEREGPAGFYSGEGELTSIRPGRNLWETNFVPDLGAFELMPWEARGAGSSNMQFLLAEGSMGAHTSEMPVGTYKKGHRHGPGLHIFFVHGTGYTLLWYEGDKEFQRVDWGHGMLFAPPDGMFHQHFDTSRQPARYLAIGFGTKRYPIVYERRMGSEGRRSDVSIKDGGCQVEYADQDPRIHALWLKELRKTGVESKMGKYFDESQFENMAV
jgi:cupin superfamily acireductone dioxygenase involved in methionine salvage